MIENKTDAEVPGISGAIAAIEKRNGVVHSTPGPWIARDTFGVRGVYLIESSEGMHIASTCELIREKWDEQKANAHLIKTSPELLKVAKIALNYLEHCTRIQIDDTRPEYPNDLVEIIAKAEGRS